MYTSDNNDFLPFAWYNDPDPSINNFFALLTPLIYSSDFDGYGDFELKLYTCPVRANEPLVGPNPMRVSYGYNHPPIQTFEEYHIGYKHDHHANMIFFDGHASRNSLQQTNNLIVNF